MIHPYFGFLALAIRKETGVSTGHSDCVAQLVVPPAPALPLDAMDPASVIWDSSYGLADTRADVA